MKKLLFILIFVASCGIATATLGDVVRGAGDFAGEVGGGAVDVVTSPLRYPVDPIYHEPGYYQEPVRRHGFISNK